jgi:hypothetical protein
MTSDSLPSQPQPDGTDTLPTNREIKFYPYYHSEAKKYIQEYPPIYKLTMKPEDIFWVTVVDEEFSDDGYFWMAFTCETDFNRNNKCVSAIVDGKWVTYVGKKTYDPYHIIKHNWFVNILLKLKIIKVV